MSLEMIAVKARTYDPVDDFLERTPALERDLLLVRYRGSGLEIFAEHFSDPNEIIPSSKTLFGKPHFELQYGPDTINYALFNFNLRENAAAALSLYAASLEEAFPDNTPILRASMTPFQGGIIASSYNTKPPLRTQGTVSGDPANVIYANRLYQARFPHDKINEIQFLQQVPKTLPRGNVTATEPFTPIRLASN